MKVSIIGLGHIGGSLALALRQNGFADYIYGFDTYGENMAEASNLGLIDEQVQPEVAIGIADLAILAIPVDALRRDLPHLLQYCREEGVVTDMGSTKSAICSAVANHEKRSRFVAGHPIAGREHSGPQSAVADLFTGKKAIIVDREHSEPEAVQRVEAMYRSLGMEILYMEREEHDVHLAYISHVSHISSFSLALSVLHAEKDEQRIFQFAGSGFDSTARLAKSSPETWAPIFIENKRPLLKVLTEYINILEAFKQNIEKENYTGLKDLMLEANQIRGILDGDFNPTKTQLTTDLQKLS
jgi:prephenate dehydrogenase